MDIKEKNEAQMDEIISYLKEQIEREENKSWVINPDGVKAVLSTYEVLKYLTKNTGAKVTCELNEPFRGVGSISVIGKDLMFENSELFMNAVEAASNFNVYPLTNGTVRMDFTFYGLALTLE